MKPMIPALLLLAMGSAQAAPIAMEDQSQLKVPDVQVAPQFMPPPKASCLTMPLARQCVKAMPCSSTPVV